MTRTGLARVLLVSLAAGTALMTAGCTGSAGDATTAVIPHSLFVEGYGVAGASTISGLAKDDGAIDVVGISGVSITPEGEGVAASSQDALDVLQAAHSSKTGSGKRVRAELMVNDIDTTKGDYSVDIATKMLSSDENRQFVEAGLAGEVEHGGYDGIQIDFQQLTDANAADLVSFASELRDTLPAAATISLALTPSTTTAGYLAEGYDLAALQKSVDRFVLLAYDEHGSGFSDAGPVGGLSWTTQSLAALTALVPASRVDLAVAGYGYTWKKGGSGGVVTPAEARKLAGDRAAWVAAQGEWTAKLADGTVIWWSDARSLTVRANLAASKKLHGVALWQMSTGDPVTRP